MPPEGMKILASPCSSFSEERRLLQLRDHTHARNHTTAHTCTPSAHVLRLRARVTHRDNRVNLKNINTGVRLQGCQGAAGEAGEKATLALHRELLDSFLSHCCKNYRQCHCGSSCLCKKEKKNNRGFSSLGMTCGRRSDCFLEWLMPVLSSCWQLSQTESQRGQENILRHFSLHPAIIPSGTQSPLQCSFSSAEQPQPPPPTWSFLCDHLSRTNIWFSPQQLEPLERTGALKRS